MNYYKTIWDTIGIDEQDGQALRMVHGYDEYFVRFVLWLKRSMVDIGCDFVCYKNVYVSGMSLCALGADYDPGHSDEYPYEKIDIDGHEARLHMFQNFMYEFIHEAKKEIITAALPYIEDGCILISGKHGGPYTNLVPE